MNDLQCWTKHPVSYLQEFMAKRNKPLPVYAIQNASYLTANKFVCTVTAHGISAVGTGSSKQIAKLEAAKQAIIRLGLCNVFESNLLPEPVPSVETNSGNYIGELNEFLAKRGYRPADYPEYGVDNKNQFIIGCNVLDYSMKGFATTKKQAKQNAAKNMLQLLKTKSLEPVEHKIMNLSPISSQSPTITNVFVSDGKVIDIFKTLRNGDNAAKPSAQENLLGPLPNISTSLINITEEKTTEELWTELSQIKPFDIEVVQKFPTFVLAVKLIGNDKITIIEGGTTFDIALCNALKKTLEYIKH